MYYIREDDIIRWKTRNNLDFINCACRFTEKNYIDPNDPRGLKKKRNETFNKKVERKL